MGIKMLNQPGLRNLNRDQILSKFSEALKSRDLDRVRTELKIINLYTIWININSKKTEATLEFFNLIASEKNPYIIFELLAHGYPVVVLAREFNRRNNHLGLQILLNLIPGLSSNELEVSEKISDQETCSIHWGIAKVPLRIDRMLVDFDSIKHELFNDKHKFNIGNLNVPLSEQLNSISLDLQYLSLIKDIIAKKHLYIANNYVDNLHIRSSIVIENTNRLNTLSILIIEEARNLRNFITMVTMILLLLAISDLYKDRTVPWEKLMFKGIFYGTMILCVISIAYQAQTCVANPFKVLDYILIRDMYQFKIMVSQLRCEIYKQEPLRKGIEDIKNFDFIAAQQRLPKLIAERFHKEYAENKYAGLFFWKQTFEARSKLIATQQSCNDPVNAPASKLTA